MREQTTIIQAVTAIRAAMAADIIITATAADITGVGATDRYVLFPRSNKSGRHACMDIWRLL